MADPRAPGLPADQEPGAPHPRATLTLHGQEAAERAFLAECRADRLPHALLLHGPRGTGKATFAYRAAGFLLAEPAFRAHADALSGDHAAARRVVANTDRRLRTLRREWTHGRESGRLRNEIIVDDVRAGMALFRESALAGGWRVVVIDTADDLNVEAANALLKILEEPPPRSMLMLISNAPHRLLPTIRSRCRRIGFRPLAGEDLAAALTAAVPGITPADLARLESVCDGSPGEAVRLHRHEGQRLMNELGRLFATLPRLDRQAVLELAQWLARPERKASLEQAVTLIERILAQLARRAVGAHTRTTLPGNLPAALAAFPSQAPVWAMAAGSFRRSMNAGRAVNLDPQRTILAAFLDIEAAARRAARAG